MALLFVDGFDAGDFAQKWSNFSSGMLSSNTTTPYGTGRSLRLNGTGGQVYKLSKVIPASARIFAGFHFNATSLGQYFFMASGDSGATQHLALSTTASGAIQVHRGSTVVATSAGSVIVTNTWSYIEVSATIHDTTGSVEVRVNNATVVTFTGDTRNGGTSLNFDLVGFTLSALTDTCLFDNFYVCNDTGAAPYNNYLGDIRINTLVPDGAGSDVGFTPSAGANYTNVDELPFSSADYVTANTSGTRDLYSMSNLSGSYTVLAVQNNAIVKKLDAGGTSLKSAIKSGGTIYYGSTQTITPNDATVTDLRTTDPATSTAWTISGVNALEAGMEIA